MDKPNLTIRLNGVEHECSTIEEADQFRLAKQRAIQKITNMTKDSADGKNGTDAQLQAKARNRFNQIRGDKAQFTPMVLDEYRSIIKEERENTNNDQAECCDHSHEEIDEYKEYAIER